MFETKAKNILVNLILNSKETIPVSLRPIIIDLIKDAMKNAYDQGREYAVNVLFPEFWDDYYGSSPLRDAALKAVFGEDL